MSCFMCSSCCLYINFFIVIPKYVSVKVACTELMLAVTMVGPLPEAQLVQNVVVSFITYDTCKNISHVVLSFFSCS